MRLNPVPFILHTADGKWVQPDEIRMGPEMQRKIRIILRIVNDYNPPRLTKNNKLNQISNNKTDGLQIRPENLHISPNLQFGGFSKANTPEIQNNQHVSSNPRPSRRKGSCLQHRGIVKCDA